MRLRVPRPRRSGDTTAAAERIRELSCVVDVEANPETGSVFIRFQAAYPVEQVLNDIRALGYLLEDVMAGEAVPAASRPPSHTAVTVDHGLRRVNAVVHEATDGVADLRVLVPAGLAVVGVIRLLQDFRALRTAPWYTLLYYALDSFYKMHNLQATTPVRTRRAATGRP